MQRGQKAYEFSGHTGNVHLTTTDRTIPVDDGDGTIYTYLPDVNSTADFMPFGLQKPGRFSNSDSYRYAFNGMEKDDELRTFYCSKGNEMYVMYAIDTPGCGVMDIRVGKRKKENLKPLILTLLLAKANSISTDKLSIYKTLIPESIHTTHRRCTNHIERKHLTLRMHIKRLNHRTIAFSRSVEMLSAVLRFIVGVK